jgi:hypothetical protein
MRKVAEVVDIIVLKSFSFINKHGGTGMSDSNFNEKYTKPVTVKITKEWNDYECGQRGHAIPYEDNDLIKYLTRNAAQGDYDKNFKLVHKKGLFKIYWSEFNIIDI